MLIATKARLRPDSGGQAPRLKVKDGPYTTKGWFMLDMEFGLSCYSPSLSSFASSRLLARVQTTPPLSFKERGLGREFNREEQTLSQSGVCP